MERVTIERITFATLAAITLGIATNTELTLDLWVVNHTAAAIATGAYIAAVTGAAIDPERVAFHYAAIPMGLLFWSARAAVAYGRIADGGPPTLWTVVYSAVGIGVAYTAAHFAAVRGIAARRILLADNDQ